MPGSGFDARTSAPQFSDDARVTTGTLIPVVSDQRFLILVDKTGKRNLLTISCERRLSASYTAGVLVNRLQDRLKNDEKQLLKTQK